jgi:hypothetical protein
VNRRTGSGGICMMPVEEGRMADMEGSIILLDFTDYRHCGAILD